MPEEVSLEKEKLYEWAADNLDKIVEDIQTILRNKPNQFVSINEIAEALKWRFEGFKELSEICLLSTCSIEYEHDFERYKFRKEVRIKDADKYKYFKTEFDRIRRELRELILREFREPRRIRKHEEQERQLQSLNEQLSRTRREEIEKQREGF
jgi:protein-arginine kinase activator protein McsA